MINMKNRVRRNISAFEGPITQHSGTPLAEFLTHVDRGDGRRAYKTAVRSGIPFHSIIDHVKTAKGWWSDYAASIRRDAKHGFASADYATSRQRSIDKLLERLENPRSQNLLSRLLR